MRFSHPGFLILFLPLLFIIWRLLRSKSGRIRFSDLSVIRQIPPSFRVKQLPLIGALRFLVLALAIFALARPQLPQGSQRLTSDGIDILLILDISESMRAEDFKPANRLQAAKEVIREFLSQRENDRLGLIVFSGESLTLCPLTLDYRLLAEQLRQVKSGLMEDGTAIGDALMNATNRLRDSPSVSKIAILLTDGENNAGEIDPITAAQVASSFGIKVYTIGMGQEGGTPIPIVDPVFGKQYSKVLSYLDEETLKQIARITSGQYFRATDERKLSQIYEQINALEITKIEGTEYVHYKELATYLLVPATLLLVLEIILANTLLRKIP